MKYAFLKLFFLNVIILASSFSLSLAQGLPDLIVESIEIEGNTKTKREVILHYVSFRKGDAVTAESLNANWLRLSQTNFFKDVDLYTRPGSEKGHVIVVIEIKERRRPFLQFEGGHSDLGGWYFVPLSLRFDNMFGRGNFSSLQFYLGDRHSKLSLNYSNRNLFDASAYLDIELHGGQQRFIHYIDSQEAIQDVDVGGLDIRFGGNKGIFKYIYFGFQTKTYQPKASLKFTENDSTVEEAGIPIELALQAQKRQFSTISIGLHADLRDNAIYPLKGFWGALIFGQTKETLEIKNHFRRFTVDARAYQQVVNKNVIAVNLKAGYVGDEATFYQRFYLGGANSFRGVPERRLTPLGYGTKFFLSHLELRFPFSSKSVLKTGASGVLFFDIGGLWQAGQDPKGEDLFNSFGFGFRFKLPVVGLTRMDFSFPLDEINDDDFQFHLSLGHAF